jgi:hypothetical protein
LNQIQQLLTLTLQNQNAINRIVGVLEKQGTNVQLSSLGSASSSPFSNTEVTTTSSNKGKAPLLSSDKGEYSNPFEE